MPRGVSRAAGRRSGRNEDLFGGDGDPLAFEREAWKQGFVRIAGVDEAGRGPLAGPVVAAAVVLPEGVTIPGVTDSKLVPEQDRERLADIIEEQAVCSAVGLADVATIDAVNIYQAAILAMERAVQALTHPPDYLIIDALSLPGIALPQKPLVKGDRRSHSVAAASIIAKVARDRIMCELHDRYPQYNFRKHKGYGTKEHLELIREHGTCEAHRKSFGPVARSLAERGR